MDSIDLKILALLQQDATLSIATMRLTLERWSAEGGTRPLLDMVGETFAAMDRLGSGR